MTNTAAEAALYSTWLSMLTSRAVGFGHCASTADGTAQATHATRTHATPAFLGVMRRANLISHLVGPPEQECAGCAYGGTDSRRFGW